MTFARLDHAPRPPPLRCGHATCRGVAQRVVRLLDDRRAPLGDAAELRDDGPLDRALTQALTQDAEDGCDVAELAAAGGGDTGENRAVVARRQRVAHLATGLMLRINDHRLRPDQASVSCTVPAVAESALDDPQFADWICAEVAAPVP